MDYLIAFLYALQSVYGPLDLRLLADGLIHRFDVPGDKPGRRNGWYVLHANGIAYGAFGSWNRGDCYTWTSRAPADQREADHLRQQMEQARRQREAEQRQRQQAAAEYARRLRRAGRSPDPGHRYLTTKGCRHYNLRQLGDMLLVPLYYAGQLVNLQRIHPDGSKRFLSGGRVKGCYSPIGRLERGKPLYICEGYATGATLHENTGHPVACAMNAGNLLAVGRQLQRQHPDSLLVIAGDNDRQTESEGKGNPGVEAANKAAAVLGCAVVLPIFPPDAPLALSDFNDLANWRAGR
ncbi:toprim domain-containing protein [Halopseudomonas aestusnigri]|jgi:putative DNA primase/helicase|uniref:toprim domain-containing protein n=1 Tax=Halopseudomonas aestusnigri TaxID=857252 RepID=UPI0028C0A22B|nr:hypothetical protein YSKK_12640 [Halopseudomonas aestusnigri]|tara:strand:+ start:948 stop:1829 length:882 start_codon:yes stop_codon:yes gene_type:complete